MKLRFDTIVYVASLSKVPNLLLGHYSFIEFTVPGGVVFASFDNILRSAILNPCRISGLQSKYSLYLEERARFRDLIKWLFCSFSYTWLHIFFPAFPVCPTCISNPWTILIFVWFTPTIKMKEMIVAKLCTPWKWIQANCYHNLLPSCSLVDEFGFWVTLCSF